MMKLETVLELRRTGRLEEALEALGASSEALRARAEQLAGAIGAGAAVEPCTSAVGGGAMPTAELPSWAVTLSGARPDAIDAALRAAAVPVIARIADGRVWLDVRTIAPSEIADVAAAVRIIDDSTWHRR